MASDLSGTRKSIDDLEAKEKEKPSAAEQPPKPVDSEQQWKATGSSESSGVVTSGKSETGNSGKWFFGFVAVILVILFISNENQINRQSSYNSSPGDSSVQGNPVVNTPAPVVKAPVPVVKSPSVVNDASTQYIEPPIGTKALLSTAQIRWCLREEIGIDTMRTVITAFHHPYLEYTDS